MRHLKHISRRNVLAGLAASGCPFDFRQSNGIAGAFARRSTLSAILSPEDAAGDRADALLRYFADECAAATAGSRQES